MQYRMYLAHSQGYDGALLIRVVGFIALNSPGIPILFLVH